MRSLHSCLGFGPVQMLGACCTQLLQSAERRQSLAEGEAIRGQEVTKELQLSQGSDSPISSESLLSLSGLSSSSNASKSSHKDSDSGMVLFYLCVEGGGQGLLLESLHLSVFL